MGIDPFRSLRMNITGGIVVFCYTLRVFVRLFRIQSEFIL